jgi:hypothetical protein
MDMSVHILIWTLIAASLPLAAALILASREGDSQDESLSSVERPLAGLTPPPARVPAPVQAADLSNPHNYANLIKFIKSKND